MLTLIWCLFHPPVTAVAHKRPQSFCQKCRWQVTRKYAYILDQTKLEWADYATVQAQYGNLSGNELTCNLSGNIQPQSSQLAEPLWTDPGIENGISVRKLISILKKRQEKSEYSPQILTNEEKATITTMGGGLLEKRSCGGRGGGGGGSPR